jgi:hypothetical protein
VKLNLLDVSQGLKVPVVNELSSVFFDELSVMPPDHDIEFLVGLVSNTASTYKRLYRMVAKQLAELKEQIKELLEKGYGWRS